MTLLWLSTILPIIAQSWRRNNCIRWMDSKSCLSILAHAIRASCAWLCTQNKLFEPSSGATFLVRIYPEVLIERCMLGNAETSKIRADVDAERTGGMFLESGSMEKCTQSMLLSLNSPRCSHKDVWTLFLRTLCIWHWKTLSTNHHQRHMTRL